MAERDALAKQAEALRRAADSESTAAIQKLQDAQEEAAAAARSAKQELADKEDMVLTSPSNLDTFLEVCSDVRERRCGRFLSARSIAAMIIFDGRQGAFGALNYSTSNATM